MKTPDEIWDECYPKCSTLRETWRMAMEAYHSQFSQPSDFHSCNNCVSQFADDCPDINPEKNKCDKYLPKAQPSDVSDKIILSILDKYQIECQMKYNTGTVPDAREWYSKAMRDGQIKPTIEGDIMPKCAMGCGNDRVKRKDHGYHCTNCGNFWY